MCVYVLVTVRSALVPCPMKPAQNAPHKCKQNAKENARPSQRRQMTRPGPGKIIDNGMDGRRKVGTTIRGQCHPPIRNLQHWMNPDNGWGRREDVR